MTLATLSYILAEGDQNELRFVVIALVVIFWIIGAVAKAAKRFAEQQKLRQNLDPRQREEIARRLEAMKQMPRRGVPVPPRRQLAPEIALRVPPATFPVRVPIGRKPKRAPSTPAPPPILVGQVAPQIQKVIQETVAPITRGSSAGANASTVHTLLRPGTLKQQFILTEIFQPPLALREARA